MTPAESGGLFASKSGRASRLSNVPVQCSKVGISRRAGPNSVQAIWQHICIILAGSGQAQLLCGACIFEGIAPIAKEKEIHEVFVLEELDVIRARCRCKAGGAPLCQQHVHTRSQRSKPSKFLEVVVDQQLAGLDHHGAWAGV